MQNGELLLYLEYRGYLILFDTFLYILPIFTVASAFGNLLKVA